MTSLNPPINGTSLNLPKAARELLHEEAELRRIDVHELLLCLLNVGWYEIWKDLDPSRAAEFSQGFTDHDFGLE